MRKREVRRSARPIEAIPPRRAVDYGGKAHRLAVLARAAFPVPAAWALPCEAGLLVLREALGEEGEPQRLLQVAREAPERLARLRERVETAPLPEAVEAALRRAHRALSGQGVSAFAVRSSARLEDSRRHAAAGLYESVLGVRSVEGLLAAARRCFAAALSERVVAHAARRGRTEAFEVGLLVQALVPADVAGVCFTVDPLTGDPDRLLVEAAWGLGGAVAAGRVSPDVYDLDKESAFPRDRLLGDKRMRLVPDPGGGLREEAVAEADRLRPCLDGERLRALAALARRVERHFREPQDIEFAFRGGRLYLLQARPVTTGGRPLATRRRRREREPDHDPARTVWSNVNVGEALPGVPTPLTWSVGGAFAERGFRTAFESVGCTAPRGAKLVTTFRGRIYLDLSTILGTLAQVPGLDPAAVLRLGGAAALRLPAPIEPLGGPAGFLGRLPVTVSRFARRNLRIGTLVERFEERFAEGRQRLQAIDLRVLAPLALDRVLGESLRLLEEAGEVLLLAYGNLLATSVGLQLLLRAVAREEAERLQRELLTGITDLQSAAPTLALWHIAEAARLDAPAREAILAAGPADLSVERLPEGPTRQALQRFLEAWGHRGPREAELAEPRWREAPELLFAALRGHLQAPGRLQPPIEVERRLREVRLRAEEELSARLPPPARLAARHLLSLVRRFVRLRERLRDRVVLVLWDLRRIALEASARFAGSEPEVGEGAAFFLLLEELRAALRKELGEVADRVAMRRARHRRDLSLPPPPPLFVGSPPPLPPPAPREGELRGHPTCAGRVRGRVRRAAEARDAARVRPGEVLVLEAADVGLSPLFPVAAAVVTDLGGPLSHAAIVLRELGVPAVLGTGHATALLRTGDLVEVDGERGTVRKLPEPG